MTQLVKYKASPQLLTETPEQITTASELLKTCTKCFAILSITEFHKDKQKRDGLRSSCRLCDKVISRQYYIQNADRVRRVTREWRYANLDKVRINHSRWRAKNPDKSKVYTDKWKKANTEKVKAKKKRYSEKYREKIKEKNRNWVASNPFKVRAHRLKRRTMEYGADGYGYTKGHHISARWAVWGGKCWICGKPAEHTDHVIPLNIGGSHWPSNLRPACSKCNLSRPRNGSDLPTRQKNNDGFNSNLKGIIQ